MAVDFGILAQTPSIGARYAEGLQLAQAEQERNMLRAMQIQQMDMQKKNMLAQDEERKAQARLRGQQELELKSRMERAARNEKLLAGLTDVLEKNNYKLDRPTLGYMAKVSLQTGDEAGAKVAMAGLQALDETERDAAEMARIRPAAGAAAPSIMRQPAAAGLPAAPAAPTNMLAGTPFDIGTVQPAPVNALAAPTAAASAAAEPMVGGFTRSQIGEMAASNVKSVRERGERLSKLLPKEPSVPSRVQEFSAFQKMTPEDQKAYLAHQAALQPKTTVSVGVSTEKKYGEQFAGNVAKADEALWSAAQDAPFAAENANRILSTLASGKAITGPLADVKLNIARALNVAGADNADMISKTEALVTSMAENTLNAIKTSGLGTGQGFTDKDLKFLQEAKSGNINFQPDTIRQLAELAHRAAEKTAEKWSGRVKQIPKSALEGTGVSTEPITVPKRASSVTATARPSGVGPDWTLMRDANGRKAWVSPDGKQHKEVQ